MYETSVTLQNLSSKPDFSFPIKHCSMDFLSNFLITTTCHGEMNNIDEAASCAKKYSSPLSGPTEEL